MRQLVAMIAVASVGLTFVATAGESKPEKATMTARGTFEVTMTPAPPDSGAAVSFGRLFGAKQFHGDLEGTGQGEMLGWQTADQTSGGYCAMELVTGTLNGKNGSFVLVHKGTMQGGNYMMDITVVPDSGTGELTGIAGTMKIIIEGTKHSYEFEYTLGGK